MVELKVMVEEMDAELAAAAVDKETAVAELKQRVAELKGKFKKLDQVLLIDKDAATTELEAARDKDAATAATQLRIEIAQLEKTAAADKETAAAEQHQIVEQELQAVAADLNQKKLQVLEMVEKFKQLERVLMIDKIAEPNHRVAELEGTRDRDAAIAAELFDFGDSLSQTKFKLMNKAN